MTTHVRWIPSRALIHFALLLIIAGCGMSALIRTASASCVALPTAGGGTSANHIMHRGKAVYPRGFNIAWFDFAKDFGNGLDEPALRQALADVREAGGNSLRWWLHLDGSSTPEWGVVNNQRLVTGPGGSLIVDLQRSGPGGGVSGVPGDLFVVIRHAAGQPL